MASFLTRNCCPMARNCQPVSVTTSDEMQMTAAMPRKYFEPNNRRMLAARLRGAVSAGTAAVSCASPTTARPLRQTRITSPAQTKTKKVIASNRLSVPNLLAIALERKPAKIPPAMAPPPTIPKTRLASRVVRT